MRFSDHRRQYTLGGLRRADLAADPVTQFDATPLDAAELPTPPPAEEPAETGR